MRVEAGKQAAYGRSGTMPGDASPPSAQRERASRALVVTAPAAARELPVHYRQASFLAHLIATKDHAPQTRERRRAEPGEAIAAYRAAAELIGSD
jgi:hypothetical protein